MSRERFELRNGHITTISVEHDIYKKKNSKRANKNQKNKKKHAHNQQPIKIDIVLPVQSTVTFIAHSEFPVFHFKAYSALGSSFLIFITLFMLSYLSFSLCAVSIFAK